MIKLGGRSLPVTVLGITEGNRQMTRLLLGKSWTRRFYDMLAKWNERILPTIIVPLWELKLGRRSKAEFL